MPTDKQTDSTSDQQTNKWTRGVIVLRENMLYNIKMISQGRFHNINKDIWFNFIQFSCQSTKKRLVISLKGKTDHSSLCTMSQPPIHMTLRPLC